MISIDVDKLKARCVELQKELERVKGLISLAEEFGSPTSEAEKIHTLSATLSSNSILVSPRIKDEPKRGFTAGLRRAVILALHTGPTTESDLARSLVWDRTRTKQVVSSMLKFHICYLSEHGKLTLSDEGKTQAQWYLANPSSLTYNPNGRKHAN